MSLNTAIRMFWKRVLFAQPAKLGPIFIDLKVPADALPFLLMSYYGPSVKSQLFSSFGTKVFLSREHGWKHLQ